MNCMPHEIIHAVVLFIISMDILENYFTSWYRNDVVPLAICPERVCVFLLEKYFKLIICVGTIQTHIVLYMSYRALMCTLGTET